MSHDPESIALYEHDRLTAQAVAAENLRTILGFKTSEQLFAVPTPEFLIDSFIQQDSIHILAAESGTGKTWLALQAMQAGANGTPFLGMDVKPFSTLYLCADSPTWDIKNQMQQLCLATGSPAPEPPSGFLPFGLNLLDTNHIKVLADYILSSNIDLLVLDVLLYAYGDAVEENSNSDMKKVYHGMKLLRDKAHCAVLCLHHFAKGTGKARGAGTILQAAEHAYNMRHSKDANGPHVLIEREKIRGESDWKELAVNLKVVNGGRMFERLDPAPSTLSLLFGLKNVRTKAELLAAATAMDLSEKWLEKELTKARKKGILVSDGKGTWTLL